MAAGLAPRSPATARGESKSLVKGVAILDALAGAPPDGLTLAELVRRTGVTKATAHRLLGTLADAGLVQALGEGRHRLGPRCLALGDAFVAGLDVRAAALGPLRRLAQDVKETCHLGVLSDDRVTYIDKVDSSHPVRMISRVGATAPAAITALGRALLATSPPDVVEAVLARPIPAPTPRTVTDVPTLRAYLTDVRRLGFAVDDVEHEEGIRCVAAPVLDHTGWACAAISVSSPAYRVTITDVRDLGARVRDAAATIGGLLGHDPARRG